MHAEAFALALTAQPHAIARGNLAAGFAHGDAAHIRRDLQSVFRQGLNTHLARVEFQDVVPAADVQLALIAGLRAANLHAARFQPQADFVFAQL